MSITHEAYNDPSSTIKLIILNLKHVENSCTQTYFYVYIYSPQYILAPGLIFPPLEIGNVWVFKLSQSIINYNVMEESIFHNIIIK